MCLHNCSFRNVGLSACMSTSLSVCISLCVCVSVAGSWCGDYCALLFVTVFIVIVCLVAVSVYVINSRHRQRLSVVRCWASKRRHSTSSPSRSRSGVSAEYAFATASSRLTVEYRPGSSEHAESTATPGEWYQQQITTLLEASF